jgi:hypothetical protein
MVIGDEHIHADSRESGSSLEYKSTLASWLMSLTLDGSIQGEASQLTSGLHPVQRIFTTFFRSLQVLRYQLLTELAPLSSQWQCSHGQKTFPRQDIQRIHRAMMTYTETISTAELLHPQLFVARQNGTMVPLIVTYELPSTMSIRGVPRLLSPHESNTPLQPVGQPVGLLANRPGRYINRYW